MSDRVEPQGVGSASEGERVDREPSGNSEGEEQYQGYQYHGNYSQRGNRGGRQGQQRGGRYGGNKYNYNGNLSQNQYSRYSGNGRNYNGYKGHRGGMNAGVAAAMNMQFAGYYNPQMYYMAPQMAAVNNGPIEGSPSTSPVSSASSTPTPTTRKIEITTKTGEHLDLNALHQAHQPAHRSQNTASGGSVAEKATADTTASAEAAPSASRDNAGAEKTESKATATSENAISEAEKTKREFLEQIKLRKAALEKKKHEQIEASKPKPVEPVPAPVEPEQKAAPEQPVKEVAKDEAEAQKAAVPEEAPEKTVTTFAEALKLKKEAAKQSAETEAAKSEPVGEPEVKKEEPPIEQLTETEAVDKEQVVKDEPAETEAVKEEAAASEGITIEGAVAEEASIEEEERAENEIIEEKAEDETIEEKAEDEAADESEDKLTVTQLLDRLNAAKPIEDIYAFTYPAGIEAPDARYKKSHIKYTYGPAFLLQFKDKVKAVADDEWIQKAASKIVIPAGMGKGGRPRDPSLFGGAGRMSSGRDFGKSSSFRNMDGRSNSRTSSKRKSKRMVDDRRSNRSYTSRRDRERERERGEEDRRELEKPKEEVAPLVPSANRWVPKSRQKKTEKKMAPDGVTELLDKEEAERKMKSLLNKLTLEMFDTISADILKIANQSKWEEQGETLNVVIEEIFHKACDEPHWSSMYAQLCGKLVKDLDPEIKDENNEGKTGPKLVLHYLVARCHTEFDKGWTDKLPTNEDGTPLEPEMMSDEYYKAAAAKRRGLGLVRFIGFLYRLNLLTGKMMFECFRRLMKDLSNAPTEETLESVVELLNTVGEQFEGDSFSTGQLALEGSALLDSLFAILQNIIENAPISSRMKFKLVDVRELRENKHWNSTKKEDGPKTIQQIHEEEERRQSKNNSRSSSRRMNTSLGSRSSFKREAPVISKDNFISTRSSSQRHIQKPAQKEEPRQPQKTATNMFSALMDDNDDDD
ncbi:hypothetical protein HG537_0E05790 [Torulaspora globosa]|uniref:MIF4G domain-containing protein n=1 Tax=Torulaspora globosa TaxID=48254 RepID=A0A7H9HVC7_9SACH|nr:hypothetical protein HG537_0E05790 [Torulaspora sp. CBS 2947]